LQICKKNDERFFGNLLIGESNVLKNKELLVGFEFKDTLQSAKEQDNAVSKSKICTLNCTLEEHFVLEFLKANPKAMQKEVAAHIRKSERTVKTITSNLQQKNLLERHKQAKWLLGCDRSINNDFFTQKSTCLQPNTSLVPSNRQIIY